MIGINEEKQWVKYRLCQLLDGMEIRDNRHQVPITYKIRVSKP